MTLQTDLVLVPVDASDRSREALSYGVAVADRYDAEVHVLHVVDDSVAECVAAGEVDAGEVADQQRALVGDARRSADVPLSHSTAVGFSRSRLRGHPGSTILDVAEELMADFVVVPREKGGEPDGTLGRAAQYVLEYASQPVLSV